MGFPGGSAVKKMPAGDEGLIPELGRSLGEENGDPLQYSCLGNPVDERSLVGYSSRGHKRVAYNLTTKQQQPSSYHFDQDFFCFEKENTWTTFKKWDKDITKIHINEKWN